MIKNAYLYAKTEVLGEKFLKDTKNKYLLIGQSPFKGKIDESGEVILPEGVKVRLQIIEDQSEPVYDKHTGDVKDNNALETFEATIIGKNYPLPFGKGTMVSLGGFLPDYSYYIDFNFILRFNNIYEYKEVHIPQKQSTRSA